MFSGDITDVPECLYQRISRMGELSESERTEVGMELQKLSGFPLSGKFSLKK